MYCGLGLIACAHPLSPNEPPLIHNRGPGSDDDHICTIAVDLSPPRPCLHDSSVDLCVPGYIWNLVFKYAFIFVIIL